MILNNSTNSNEQFEWHINITQNNTAIAILDKYCKSKQIGLSKSELKQAMSKGAMWLTRSKHTQRLRRIKKEITIGDELHFYYNKKVLEMTVPDAKLIDDLTDYSVWYKPYGMLSQGSKWSDHCTITRFAQLNLQPERPVFIVHRLDRAATGLILVAHSKKSARALSTMFEKHELEKHYQIIIHGDHSKREQPEVISTEIDGKSARSIFTCLSFDKDKNRSLIDVKIDSGRKHQIRIHAASIGMPVVGDRLHGNSHKNDINLQLCAISLSFTCPISGKKQQFNLPNELKLNTA